MFVTAFSRLSEGSTLYLPNPSGSTVLAGWVPTNAEVVDGELDFTGPWLSSWNSSTVLAPSYTNGQATWELTSSFIGTNFMGTSSIYTMNTANVNFQITASNYSGTAFDKVILQLTSSTTGGRADQFSLNASLNIGGMTYTAGQATFSSDDTYGGNFSDPTNRYYGNYGGLALVTYEWDLATLGYSGNLSDFSLSWNFPQNHSTIYDAQVSVTAVPEPGSVALLAGLALIVTLRLLRRRRAAIVTVLPPLIAIAGSISPAMAVVAATDFPLPNPSVTQGNYNDGNPIDAQLSGMDAISGHFGSLDAPDRGFVAWEKFYSGNFSDLAVQYSGNSGLLSASLSQSNEDIALSASGSNTGLITVDGTDYYGRLTAGLDASYEFTLTAQALMDITSVTLAIKHSNFFEIDGDNWTQIAPFSAILNGFSSNPVLWGPDFNNFSDALSLSTYSRFYLYSWNIEIAAGDTFTLQFSSVPETIGLGFSVDSIGLNVQAIPEPSTFLLLGMGLALGVFYKSQRRR